MQSRKIIAARASIAASALLAATKLAVGLWSGSLALLSEAGHAFVDTGATVLTYFAIREAKSLQMQSITMGMGKLRRWQPSSKQAFFLASRFSSSEKHFVG